MNRKLQVFISGTFVDLVGERQGAVEAILEAKHIPEGMEFFVAEDRPQMDVIKRKIRESDVLLILIGPRYGSLEPDSGKSYTHLEYLYALEIKRTVIAMVMKPEAVERWETANSALRERVNGDKLEAFRKEVINKRLASFFSDVRELNGDIFKALITANENSELVGWVRRDETVNAGEVLNRLVAVETERDALRARVKELEAQVSASSTLRVPPEAREIQRIEFVDANTSVPFTLPINYLDWFRAIGRKVGAGVVSGKLTEFTRPYIESLPRPPKYQIEHHEFIRVVDEALGAFTIYGWVDVQSSVTSSPKGEIKTTRTVTLTPLGKALLLSPSAPEEPRETVTPPEGETA